METKVLGIVLTYNEINLTKNAIRSLADSGVDVALVFNGWHEKYNKHLRKLEKYIDYKFLNYKNIGFCRGNNLAINYAIKKGYDYVFLLNNDAWIDEECLPELLKVAEKKEDVGMLQPKVYKAWNNEILDTTGLVFKYGNKYSWERGLGYIVDRGQNEHDIGKYDNRKQILGCCACAALYKIRMLKEIGLFWEKLWSMGEDVELSWRAYTYGWRALYVPSAIAYHWRGYSTYNLEKENKNLLKKLWSTIGYRNWTLILEKFGSFNQKIFCFNMWMYYGTKSWVGRRIGKNNIGGKIIWICALALLNKQAKSLMENIFNDLFDRCGIK